MKESSYVRKLLVASAILVMAVPAMASASSFINDEGNLVVRVSYADLNLATEAGLVALYERLKDASSAACGPRLSLRVAGSLERLHSNRQCYDGLLSKLVARVDNAMLDEIHAG